MRVSDLRVLDVFGFIVVAFWVVIVAFRVFLATVERRFKLIDVTAIERRFFSVKDVATIGDILVVVVVAVSRDRVQFRERFCLRKRKVSFRPGNRFNGGDLTAQERKCRHNLSA